MPTPTSEDVTQARAAGYREGLEAAAEIAQRETTRATDNRITQAFGRPWCEAIAARIRALAAPAAEPNEDR